ncbi:MAG: transposase [Acidobacteriota bacterium]|nr:transposase [Acidobacteriota bacterium]
MKMVSETKSLRELQKLKTAYQDFIKTNYEHRAQDCQTCPTKGACCLDAHFVNVHITRLEAVAVRKTLEKLSAEKQREIYARAEGTIEKYDLKTSGDTFAKTFACPLFEKGIGCLVHSTAKPAPCISHACYENKEDLPPEQLQERVENSIEKLNRETYGNNLSWLPLPVWLGLINPFEEEQLTAD